MSIAIVTFGEAQYDIKIKFKDNDITNLSPRKIHLVEKLMIKEFRQRISEMNAVRRQKVMDQRIAEDKVKEDAEDAIKVFEAEEIVRGNKQAELRAAGEPYDAAAVAKALGRDVPTPAAIPTTLAVAAKPETETETKIETKDETETKTEPKTD